MENRDNRLMSLLDAFLEEHKDELTEEQSDTVTTDYVAAYLDSVPEMPDTAADRAIKSRTESLLDAFFQGGSELHLSVSQDSDGESDDTEEPVFQTSDSCYTETLARVYLKQHRYDRALEIIRSLYLNFPNKSIYFADQIRYLEKLVVINQKTK